MSNNVFNESQLHISMGIFSDLCLKTLQEVLFLLKKSWVMIIKSDPRYLLNFLEVKFQVPRLLEGNKASVLRPNPKTTETRAIFEKITINF